MRQYVLTILANTQTPYRIHFHRRIVREMPEIKLWSLFTHEHDKQRWPWVEDETIGTRCFGWGESIAEPPTLKRLWRDWRKGGRVIDWLKRHRTDALLVLGYADIGKVRVLRWAKLKGIPTMMFMDSNIYGDNARHLKRFIKRAALRCIFSMCDALLVCGSAGEAYVRSYGVIDNKIYRSPCEPDYELYQNVPEERVKEVKRRYGMSEGRRRLVYCGRMSSEKRVDLLLRAFARIAELRPQWDLVLVGDGPLRQDLASHIKGIDSKRIVWTGFQAEPETVAAIYRACDALVAPSDYEAWGLVVNEALAAGLAVVASNVVGAAQDLVEEGVNGAFFEPGDEEDLARALAQVTSEESIQRFKKGSRVMLERWRQCADPVVGLRTAMNRIGALNVTENDKCSNTTLL